MADVLGLIYDVSKDFIKFAADFVETPDIIKIMTREIQILEKQLNAPSSEGLTKDDDLDALSRDLEVFVKSLRLPDGKSRRRKWTHQAVQAVQSKSLHDRLTSLNLRYQAQVNARLVKSQCDAQESLVSQKEALDAIAAVAIHVDEQINAIRAEKLKALGAEVLHWLSPPANESDKHALLIEKHHAGTGAWLYETDEFKAWESRSDDGSAAASPPGKQIQTLWLHGKPGAGKSTMFAQIVERLTKNLQAKAVVLRVYCDYKATESQTRLVLLKSVLRQAVKLLLEVGELPGYIEDDFHVYAESLGVTECKLLLCRVLGEFTECVMAIDGLDEYENLDPYRNEGIDILNDLHQAFSGADTSCCRSKKMLIASRENCLKFYESSNSTFIGTTRLTRLEFLAPKGDVESMVRSYLLNDGFHSKQKLNSSPEILTEVTEKVCARSENLFLVAQIQLNGLDQARTIRDLKKTADALPTGINDTYESALELIMHRHGAKASQPHGKNDVLGLRILAIVSKARRQLTIEELLHALAVEPGDSSFDSEALLDDHGDIIRTTGGLLHIRQGIIDVCHKTLTEYLCKPDTRERYFPEAVTLAEICLTYMSFTEFQEPCDDRATRRKQFPLLQYAVRNVGYHVSDALERKPELLNDCLAFLNGPPPLETFQVAVAPTLQRPVASRMQTVRDATSLIHMAVYFGMPFLLEEITKKIGTGRRGYKEETALHTAARARQVDAATRFIDAGADVNATGWNGKTPLDVIMNRPYLGFKILAEDFDVASILVDAAAERFEPMKSKAEPGSDVGIDVEFKIRIKQITAEDFQNLVRTDFRQKSKENAKDIVMLIALNDVSLDITDEAGEIVMKLLDAKADVNSESMPEATALQLAAIYGRQSIVKALLDKNANPFLVRRLGYTSCDLALMRDRYGKQGGQWKAIHEMLAERMAEWRQKELEEPDEEKKLLIPGPKQAEKLELKASDAYDLRRQHLYAKSRATLEEANVQQLGKGIGLLFDDATEGRQRTISTPLPAVSLLMDSESQELGHPRAYIRQLLASSRVEFVPTQRHRGESIHGPYTPLPTVPASMERSQERYSPLLGAVATGVPSAGDMEVRLGVLGVD